MTFDPGARTGSTAIIDSCAAPRPNRDRLGQPNAPRYPFEGCPLSKRLSAESMIARRARVLVGSVTAVDRHDTGRGHPERPARLNAVEQGINDAGLGEAVGRLKGKPASLADLSRVHDERYLDAMAQLSAAGGGDIDPDTPVSPGSWETAVWAAGSGLDAIDALAARGRRRRLRGRQTTRAPRQRDPGHGFLPAQQHRGRRRRSGRPRTAGTHRRLGRPPRQRNPGDLLERPEGAVRLDAPVAGVPGYRSGYGHGRGGGAGPHDQRAPSAWGDR